MKHTAKQYMINLIVPAVVFGSVTGVLTAAVITLYKVCAKYIFRFSEQGYHALREHWYGIPVVAAVLLAVAFVMAHLYRRVPNLKGGGLPTSIGILRGIIPFKWLKSLVGVFCLSLTTFLVGVPLGNEGPSVQMGAAVGKAAVSPFAKRHGAWNRYAMTGGACAGFSVATGAPISGIMFAVEEAHQRISPMIIIVSATSVMFAQITSAILSPLCGVSVSLFPQPTITALDIQHVWIPAVVGIVIGLFAVAFLRYYEVINRVFNRGLGRVPHQYKIFIVFMMTLACGLFSTSFISTGHDLILELFHGGTPIYLLLLILLVRSTLTLSANTNKITGGIFVPLLALGATVAALLAEIGTALGLSQEYYIVILVLGIVACIASVMKLPITAIVFAIEALGCHSIILYVIVVAAVSFIITEVFGVKSITDTVVEDRLEELHSERAIKVIDTHVKVGEGAFAVGKQIRDIFWPANLFVLSVKHDETKAAEVDGHGGKALREGDVLHVRYSTYHEQETREELLAIVGEQEYSEHEVEDV